MMMSNHRWEVVSTYFEPHVENWRCQEQTGFNMERKNIGIVLVDVAQLQACDLPDHLAYDVCGL